MERRSAMMTYGGNLWARLARAAGLLVVLALSRAFGGGVEVRPPSPIQVGEEPLPLKVELPARPAPLAAAPAPKAEEKVAPPRREWRILSPKHVVSDQSMLFVSVADFRKASQAYARSALAGLLGEEEIQRQLADVLQRLQVAYVEGDGTLPRLESRRRASEIVFLSKLCALLEGPVGLAVDAPSLKPSVGGVSLPRFMLVVAMNDEKRQAEIAEAVEALAGAQLTDPRFRDEAVKVGPYEVRCLRADEIEAYESCAFVENLFLYGWGKGIVQEAITAYQAQDGKGTVALSTGYDAAFSRVGADALVYAQFDGAELLKKFGPDEPTVARIWQPIMESLTRNRPQAAVGIQVLDGAADAPLKERLLLRVDKAALPPGAGPCQALSRYLAGTDALFYHTEQTSLEALLRGPLSEPAEAGQAIPLAGALNALMNALKVESEKDVWKMLAPFRGEAALVLDYIPGESLQKDWQDIFQLVFAVEISRADLENVNAVLRLLREATGVAYRQVTIQGTDLFYQAGATPDEALHGLRIHPLLSPRPREEGEPPGISFFVAQAIQEVVPPTAGEQPRLFLLLSDNLKALKKAIQQARLPRHSLGEREDFKRLVKQFDESRYTLSYLNLPGLVSALYRQLVPELMRKGLVNRNVLAYLPPDTAVMRHLSPMGWASAVRDEGLITDVVSPAGNLPMLGLVGALAWPAYNARQQQETSQQISENLKEIGLGLHLYAAVFDRFPVRLSDLFPDYVKDLRTFGSPFDNYKGVARAEDIDDWRKSNLVYQAGRSFQDLSQEVLVYEVRPTMIEATEDKGYRVMHHVLQLDGKVRPLPLSRLKRLVGANAAPLAESAGGRAAAKP